MKHAIYQLAILVIAMTIMPGYASEINFETNLLGKPATKFSLPSLSSNEKITLSDYRGKLILLNFWASWCGPCRAEFPTLINLQRDFKNRNFTIIGLAMDNPTDAEQFVSSLSVNFPIAVENDEVKKILSNYGNPDNLLPYSVLISPKQEILTIFSGIISENKARRIIGRLLNNF